MRIAKMIFMLALILVVAQIVPAHGQAKSQQQEEEKKVEQKEEGKKGGLSSLSLM